MPLVYPAMAIYELYIRGQIFRFILYAFFMRPRFN